MMNRPAKFLSLCICGAALVGCTGFIDGGDSGKSAVGPGGSGAAAGTPDGTSGTAGTTGTPGAPGTPGAACDIQAVMAKPENGCVNSLCHGAQYQGGLDLASPGVETRLVDVHSTTEACGGEPLIDSQNPENSLLLRLIDPARFAAAPCGVMMPFGTKTGVSAEDLSCFESWVTSLTGGANPTTPVDPAADFEPVSPDSYVSKVKTMLTGHAATPEEIAAVKAAPESLRGLVTGWLELPEVEGKLSEFFVIALQQRLVSLDSLDTQFTQVRADAKHLGLFRRSLEESFVRTAVDIVQRRRPFTDILSTRRWAVSTATLVALAYLEETAKQLKDGKHTIVRTAGVDSPDEKIWHVPTLPAECNTTIDEEEVLDLFFGTVQCVGPNYRWPDPILTDADYSDWRFVDLSQATSKAEVPRFYDIEKLRTLKTVPLMQPRNGFFTSPAFLANWETNEDNQFRVTTSQTLIVALGEILSPADPTVPVSLDGLAEEHAQPGTTCYGCHQFLDPMRQYFAREFSFEYQAPQSPSTISPSFAFKGVVQDGGDIDDFTETLAGHPKFPTGWVQKLCYWANSQPCDSDDPEFVRIAKAFVDSGYDFKTLLVELMSSPLVTGASYVQTFATAGPFVSITRKQHLCQMLDARMGVDDACGVAALFAGLVPEDEFARGSAEPVQTAVTGLFHIAAGEQLCLKLASKLVGDAAASRFKVSEPASVIDELTSSLMGLPPGHSRHDATRTELQAHYDAVLAAGNTKTDALRSTFVVACQSPDVMAIGL